jgi:hypothetical protein
VNREALHRQWIVEHGHRGPYCSSLDTERCGAFGAFHMTEPYICRTCGSPFHRIRWQSPSEVETRKRG